MNELIAGLSGPAVISNEISLPSILLRFGITFLLTFYLAGVYRKIHRKHEDCRIMMHSMIYIGMIITGTMIVIGSSVTVAIGMLGAVSIIRFRSAMKNPIDMAFIFLSIVTGISSGIGFLLHAFLIILIVSVIMLLLNRYGFGSVPPEQTRCEITVTVRKKYIRKGDEEAVKEIIGGDSRIQEIRIRDDKIRMQFIKTITHIDSVREIYETLHSRFSGDPALEIRIINIQS